MLKICNRSIIKKMKCKLEKCVCKASRRGYCDKHYREKLSSGELRYKIKKFNKNNASLHPLYYSWQGMVQRCTKPYTKCYKNYGGRGIKVCERWSKENGFWNFVEDMGPRPKGCSLDRIDVNGDYCPENCRWATKKEQSENKRNSIRIIGRTVKDISQLTGFSEGYIRTMVRNGMTDTEIINHTREKQGKRVQVRCVETGEIYPSTEAARRAIGASRGAVSQCIRGSLQTAGGYHWERV